MRYTYDITFNGSDYISFTPVTFPKISVEKNGMDYFWTTKISEVKIGKNFDSSTYDTLETWYDDSTKHANNIQIRIKKDSVTKWEFQFGIRQGTLDYELKTYIITPTAIEPITDVLYYQERLSAPTSTVSMHYNDENFAAPSAIYSAAMYSYEQAMTDAKNYLNTLSDNTYTIQSAFLWNDNYPDGSSSGAENYVSSDYNYLNYLAVGRDRSSYSTMERRSFKDWVDVAKMFQCYYFVSSDYVIHMEHISWFIDNISDYQVDLSGEEYYDDSRIFVFSAPEVYAVETFIGPTEEEDIDDWVDVQITYVPELVGFSNDNVETRTEYDTYLSSDFANMDKFMAVGADELAVGYRSETSWTTFDTDGPDVTDGEAAGSGAYSDSNYVSSSGTSTINWSVNVTYTSFPLNELEIVPLNAGTPGSAVTLNAGANSGSFLGDSVRIQSTGAVEFSYTMSLKIDSRYRIPWETGVISGDYLQNCYLSWANNIDRFWQDDRYAQSGIINGSDIVFNSSKRVREQKEFKFYYDDDIDPMRGINTDYGVGMIQTYERDLATDFVTVTLRYE